MELVKESMPCPSIHQYLDYRKFLEDFYCFKKTQIKNFSYSMFCHRSGIRSPNYIKLIISGKRNLTAQIALGIAKACNLDKIQTHYFLALIDWNHAKTDEDRTRYWAELLKWVPQEEIYVLQNKELQVLAKWYILPILEMIRLKDFIYDANWLSKRFNSIISASEMENVFKLLLDLELVKEKNGSLVITNKILFSGGKIPSELIKNYHAAILPTAQDPLYKVDMGSREYAAASIAVRKEDLQKLKKEIRKFHQKILQYGASITGADDIYQLNLQFFPLTSQEEK